MKEYDRDSFWNIEKLVPKKSTTLSTFSTKEKVVDFSVPSDSRVPDSSRTRLTPRPDIAQTDSEAAEYSYTLPSGLIKEVSVCPLPEKFDFHANFVKAAQLYFDFSTPECDFAPYYSYMPQYTQLTAPQKNYYFYWRSMVRQKKHIKTDYSYFYLYVYELLNLPELVPAERGLDLLLSLWCAYRKQLPNVDSNMALWIQDYCLIYGLECPLDRIRDFIFSVVGTSSFKEFYLSDAETLGPQGVSSVIAYLSDYDWRSGKYAGGDNREAYAKHLTGAMSLLVSKLLLGGKILGEGSELATMERIAFRGALTTSKIKYRIKAKYRPIAEETGLRGIVTSALKYTENKLRALMGVKSRLAVKDFPDEYRNLIDSYFSELFDKVNRERARAARPEYEKLYEAENTSLSLGDADEIERVSWQTTSRLTEDMEEYSEQTSEQSEPQRAEEKPCEETYGLQGGHLEFIRHALSGDGEKIKECAAALGKLSDAVADEINEAFSDGFGDVILEPTDDGYAVLDDYREDIEIWLSKVMR